MNWFDELEAKVNEAFEKMTNEELMDSLIDANRGSSDCTQNPQKTTRHS